MTKCSQNIETFLFFVKRNIKFSADETEETNEEYQLQSRDDKFISSLAFLTNISNNLNILNMKLQGKKYNTHLNWSDTLKVYAINLCCLGLFCKGMMRPIFLNAVNYLVKKKYGFFCIL